MSVESREAKTPSVKMAHYPRRWSVVLADGDRSRQKPCRPTAGRCGRDARCALMQSCRALRRQGVNTVTADATPDRESQSSDEIFLLQSVEFSRNVVTRASCSIGPQPRVSASN